jgi:hypothetical protein
MATILDPPSVLTLDVVESKHTLGYLILLLGGPGTDSCRR